VAAGEPGKPTDDLGAKPASLVGRVDGHVGDIGAVKAVRQYPSGASEIVARVGAAQSGQGAGPRLLGLAGRLVAAGGLAGWALLCLP